MGVKLKNIDGSGSVADTSPISYSYTEDVTTLEPSTLDGGNGQVSVSALSVSGDKVGNTHPNSKLLINNTMQLQHTDGGSVEFQVKQVSVNQDVVSVTGNTIASRLNAEVTAGPYGASGGTYKLLGAIEYYCGLAGISTANGNLEIESVLASELDAIPVNFIGWKGNLWDHLKMLCSATSASLTDNVGFEMYNDGAVLKFRKAKTDYATYSDRDLSDHSVAVTSLDAAKEVSIFHYDTEYKTQSVFHDLNLERSGLSYATQNVTIADALSVSAGETLVRRFNIDAHLETVYQPQAVDAIIPLPYTGGIGQYAIAGSDGILIKAAQWEGLGGSLKVATTENPGEIVLTIIAPPVQSIEQVGGTSADLGYSPYRIGVEVADGQDYPAIYLTGTGVFYKKTEYKIATGASDEYTTVASAPTIDNPFITTLNNMYSRGTAAAQAICGPQVILSEKTNKVLPFGTTPGKMRKTDSNEFRITSVSYGADGTSITGVAAVSFAKFDAQWSGKTFDDFNLIALKPADYPLDALKFNEFSVIPLMESA